jgi:hypothetical protein
VVQLRTVATRLRRGAVVRARLLVAGVLLIVGALALALGWYGVSGESLVAKQLPYLVSGGLAGVALVILAAVLFGAEIVQRELARTERLEQMVSDLHAALLQIDERTAPIMLPGSESAVLAVPSGTTYHRPDCSLVAGKPGLAPVDAAELAKRNLRACRVCRPDEVADAAEASTAETA